MFKKFQETLSFDDVLLVPIYSEIVSRKEVLLQTNLSLKRKFILDIPIFSAAMDTVTESKMAIALGKMGGIGIIHRFITTEKQVVEVKKSKSAGVRVGAAVGVKNGEMERAKALVNAGVDLLVLDIAHGHSKYGLEKTKLLRKMFPKTFIIAGTVATGKGFLDLARAGADAVRVGIGAGSICTTRIVTGFGVPQISAILDCLSASKKTGVGLISDGGIKNSGDIVKALAAGACAIMTGNILAGTDEAPGKLITYQGKKFKVYRGMASLQANLSRFDKKNNKNEIIAEGVSGAVPYKGSVVDVIKKTIGGIRSGLSYAGAKDIKTFQKKASFIRITPSGFRESNFHDIFVK
ncbi:MAG: IMP dehydrogenase [Candidatus Paceibacterota bacterium]|jgi:IMP dehydrogenase